MTFKKISNFIIMSISCRRKILKKAKRSLLSNGGIVMGTLTEKRYIPAKITTYFWGIAAQIELGGQVKIKTFL